MANTPNKIGSGVSNCTRWNSSQRVHEVSKLAVRMLDFEKKVEKTIRALKFGDAINSYQIDASTYKSKVAGCTSQFRRCPHWQCKLVRNAGILQAASDCNLWSRFRSAGAADKRDGRVHVATLMFSCGCRNHLREGITRVKGLVDEHSRRATGNIHVAATCCDAIQLKTRNDLCAGRRTERTY